MALLEGTVDGAPRLDDPAAREVAEIEAELARARARVAASMRTLGEEVARRGDWRAWVRARPELTLAAALTLGFLWGHRGGRRPEHK
ncbi:MAG TPA: hypothetical protein VH560_01150 [Polyangia bacterium]|jgi:hypothetical protein|nr:hypothetical protein [Polyangia bacterium]